VLDDRKLDVLRAIVEDYVSTQEPVGSKALVERHTLGVSPATVRNDMAVLEEEGFITQPHTSAGRIPTDKGYRLFVDKLTSIKQLTGAEKRAIATFLQGAVDLDDVVHRSVRLLAQLTQQIAIVQYPTLARSTVRHVEVVTIAPRRLLLVLITSTGRVEQRVIELSKDLGDDVIGDLRARFNTAVVGQLLSDAAARVSNLPDMVQRDDRAVVSQVIAAFAEAVADERTDEKVVIGGTANLVRFGDDFDLSIKPLLEALEEHVVLLKLLGEATSPSLVTVRIGHEVQHATLATTSVVATGYGPGERALATLGVVGPTRMDYPGSMAAVTAVARYVSQILSDA
jgi:heat-inducible transcriptional repressor